MTVEHAAVHATHQYDAVPYQSFPFPQTEPGRLAAVAHVLGLKAPAVARARVLELGCASGGNLIPMAARYPDAEFLGIDASAVQIAEGCARIETLGLGNIELRQGDIRDIAGAAKEKKIGAFDFVISHGVYSWVPDEVRAAMLDVCRHALTPNGVAYISYNVYPGWHMRGVVRDVMLFHAGDSGDPQTRVARARWMLDELAKSTGADTAYGTVLRQDARLLAATGDDYVFHEFLEKENAPCHVRDFFALARQHGLDYLSEADISATCPEAYGPETARLLRTISSNAVNALEQYIDYFTGRAFRQTLLVRAEAARQINRQILPGRVAGLSLTADYAADPEVTAQGLFLFRSPRGATLTTSSPVTRDALSALAKAGAATRTPSQLLAAVLSDQRPTKAQHVELLDALLKLLLMGMVGVSTMPAWPASEIAERPLAPRLARIDAEAGRMWTTNLLHQRVNLNVVQHALLPKLDGDSDRASLKARLLECVRQGTLRFEREGSPITDEAGIATAAGEHLQLALEGLQRAGLLVPSEARETSSAAATAVAASPTDAPVAAPDRRITASA